MTWMFAASRLDPDGVGVGSASWLICMEQAEPESRTPIQKKRKRNNLITLIDKFYGSRIIAGLEHWRFNIREFGGRIP